MLSALDMSLEDYMQSKAYMDALGFKIEKSFEIQKMELQNDLNKDSMEKSNELNIKATKESAKINAQYNKNNDNNNSNSSKSSTSKTSVKSTKVSTGTKADEEKSASETGMGNKVGRPSVSDSDVENDSTGASKDAGNNTSDIKEFSSEFSVGFVSPNEYKVDIPDDKDEFVRPVCAKCGKELERDEEYICDECLENYFGERLGDL